MAASADPKLVVFAWGNLSRADDGAGPEIAERLRALRLDELLVIEDMQLQIEHTADIVPGVPVLFIDASVAISEGFALERLKPQPDSSVTTHALCPTALLQLFETTSRRPSPAAFQLHIAAQNFELGEKPGVVNASATEAAWVFLADLLGRPPGDWGQALERSSVERLEPMRSVSATAI
ncbi:MAG: hypothetical protein QNJ05_09585 [Woeseiaceae bacterium]|nr:hypothetical protein [Woeseiaceae bacterium]